MAKQHNDIETIESLELNAKLVRPKEATVPLMAAGADEGEDERGNDIFADGNEEEEQRKRSEAFEKALDEYEPDEWEKA